MPSKWSPGCGCCGEVECDCTECTEDVRGPCVCITEDYGEENTVGDLTVDVTGTGYFGWSAGIPSMDVTGSFTLACNTRQRYIQTSFWKTESSVHFFSYVILRFSWVTTINEDEAWVETGYFTKADTTNPYPTRTSVATTGDPRDLLGGLVATFAYKARDYSFGSYLAHFCEHDSVCRQECDPGTTVVACPSGTLSATETNINQSGVTIVLTV